MFSSHKKVNITVRATWDDEAAVWVAISDDVAGLVTEAATQEELMAKLKVMIPELMALNGEDSPSVHTHQIPFALHSEQLAYA